MDKKQKILIIDDEKQIRKLLSINLKSSNFDFVEAGNGKEGLNVSKAEKPDAIFLDLGLPDEDGLNILEKLREWYKGPIIIISVRDYQEEIVKALDSGANDYVTKPFKMPELMARLRVALRTNPLRESEPVFTEGSLKVDFTNRTVIKNNEIVKLSTTEYSILWLFIHNSGKVLTHKYILQQTWGSDYEEETQYLRVYIGQLRKKIEDDPANPLFILTEPGIGYRFTYNG
jgi:two-component system KDP operon response regulator KdpE